jgi:hypothetical protein
MKKSCGVLTLIAICCGVWAQPQKAHGLATKEIG